MAVPLLTFTLVMVPVAFCLGFSAATISFTAWNVSVPLFLNVFGFSVRQTLFLSVIQDFFNSLALSLLYGRHGKVDWKYGAVYGAVGAVGAISLALFMAGYIEQHEEMLESYMFFVPFVLGIGFLIKGLMVLHRRRQQTKASWVKGMLEPVRKTAKYHPAADIEEAHLDGVSAQTAATLAAAASALASVEDASDSQLIKLPPIAFLHEPVLSLPATPGTVTPAHDDDQYARSPLTSKTNLGDESDDDDDVADMMIEDVAMDDETPDIGGDRPDLRGASRWTRFLAKFASKEDILKKRMSRKGTRLAAMGAFTLIMGCISGVLFFGGGMAFALGTASFFKVNVRHATGSACFMCAIIMFALLLSFIKDPSGEIRTHSMFVYTIITVAMGMLGSVAGAKLSMRISDVAIFFFISLVLVVLGIVITVQRFAE